MTADMTIMTTLPMRSADRRRRSLPLVAVVCLAMGLAGCATNGPTDTGSPSAGGSNRPLTQAEQDLRKQSNNYTSVVAGGIGMGAAVGCGLGAGVGLLSALLAPRENGNALGQAAVLCAAGAVAGGVVGGLDGYQTAKRRGDQQQELASIQKTTDAVKADNAKLEASIKTSRTVIDQTRARLTEAQARYKRNEITAAELNRERQRAEANVAALDKLINAAQKQRDQAANAASQMQASGPQATAELDAQIAESTTKLAELQKERDLLAQDINVGRIG